MVGGLLDISKDSSQLSNTSTGSSGSHAGGADLNGQCSSSSFASIMASNGLGGGGANTIGTLAAGMDESMAAAMLPAGLNPWVNLPASSATFESTVMGTSDGN
jgi:hypothetical protein